MTRPEDVAVLRLAEALGGADRWRPLGRADGPHRVWLVEGPAGAAVLKQFAHPRAYAQELAAYTAWLPRLAAPAPALRGRDDAARTLALAAVPGEPLSRGTWSLAEETAAHAAAGRFARALHGLPVADADPVPLVAAVQRRLAHALASAQGLLTPAERDGLAARARDVDAFAGARRVACHRDFTPDNWLVAGTGWSVVDFEHARPDAAEVDLVKLRADAWHGRPGLQAAFLAAYGGLSADQAARLDVLLALHAAATLAWAERHADPAFRALGRRALAAALE